MTFLLAILPVLWLILALVQLKLPAWQATSIGSIIALALSVLAFGQSLSIMLTGALEGAALAIWPIGAVIVGAIYSYNLVVHTKAMDIIKVLLSSISKDKRVLGLILAWGFSHFMEGMAGFGTAVAIPSAMMVAIGFNPLRSIVACLAANCVSTSWRCRLGHNHFGYHDQSGCWTLRYLRFPANACFEYNYSFLYRSDYRWRF